MTIPSTQARIAAGLVALVAWTGLAIQLDASIGIAGSLGGAVAAMLRYFTVIGNLLAAVLFTGIALGRPHFATPFLLGGITLTLLLIGIVYALLLRGLVELSGGAQLANILLHKATPVLVPCYWLAFAPKTSLTRRDPFAWALLPLAYFGYALIRGAIEGRYAYPFLDVGRLGWAEVGLTALVMALAFLAGGFALIRLSRFQRQAAAKVSPG